PDTGVGLQRERILSSLFISSPDYGTRSSSIILIEKSGQIAVMERTFLNTANGTETGETVEYSFNLNN
ncbi:MAG: NRDE family protein, partial [Desulfobacterales bacterium]|nr:NRDE family protein [Desulfobacterales bacterium]